MKTPKNPTVSPILTDEKYLAYAKLIKSLNSRWQPHSGQIEAGELIFAKGVRRLFIECGRKWGKSEFAVDLCWRLGNMIQGGQGYYFGAYAKAVREIVWASNRLQSHGSPDFIKDQNKTEMRITFTSDTFVKCEGADEFKLIKGFNPDFVILDEFADYSEDFWNAMSPNFASKDCIVIIISSPPWLLESEPGSPVYFVRIADLWKKHQKDAARLGKKSKYAYINQPTWKNPHIEKKWLDEERENLIGMGLEDIWEREYCAKRVVGGGKRILGTFDQKKHKKDHDWIIENKIKGRHDELEWVHVVDPGSSSVFASLFIAINPYEKEVYFLDEHYCKTEDETTEHILRPIFSEKENELYSTDINSDTERWSRVYDEAAKWWQVGVMNEFGITYNPTEKAVNSKEYGLSVLRTLFRWDRGYVSDRCKWFIWELENYRKDKYGRIPKINDHLIDSARYGLHHVQFFLLPEDREKAVVKHVREQWAERRSDKIEEDVKEMAEDLYGKGMFADAIGASDYIGEL